ncbi:MAG: tRNA (adenosine(37)-N6)-threonylcarbamoyltransferase complex transferase subunit TsaD [Patescibacteria group bacterium]
MRILAIESSCDETAAAVVENGTKIISTVVATSHAMHEKYGGIVPEVAARMQLESVIPTITESLLPLGYASQSMMEKIREHVDAIAVTVGPGLIGSLLVGVEAAKTIAFVTNKPIIPVNHVLAHMYANFVTPQQRNENNTAGTYEKPGIQFPAISLVVSGGHTELYLLNNEKEMRWLGGTIDDAAGECFDKTARLLGFGHGGGLAIQEAATRYKKTDISPLPGKALPIPMLSNEHVLDFSFSGLKTAILRKVTALGEQHLLSDDMVAALSYEVQETITDVLVKKTLKAVALHNAKAILLSGGVSANLRLREKFLQKIALLAAPVDFHVPPVSLCTDNAVYIASYAHFRGVPVPVTEVNATPDLSVEVLL